MAQMLLPIFGALVALASIPIVYRYVVKKLHDRDQQLGHEQLPVADPAFKYEAVAQYDMEGLTEQDVVDRATLFGAESVRGGADESEYEQMAEPQSLTVTKKQHQQQQ
jgi:hypothetical protein